MTDPSKVQALRKLFVEVEAAHRETAVSREEDPEWALWYADYLAQRLPTMLGMQSSRSELVACLLRADQEHRARFADRPWVEFSAEHFCECYAASPQPARDKLALYHYDMCPFCVMVSRVIDELGVEVELRNIWDDRTHRTDLVAARGRATVPVLRITGADGEDRWMPESRDINRYLRKTYG